MKRKYIALQMILCLSLLFLSGCNTVNGIGKDMQAGGEEIQKAVAH